MMIFLGNLPRLAREQDLLAMLNLAESERHRVRIVKKLTRSGEMVRFGLFQARTDQQARKTLQQNSELCLQSQPLIVREFVKRVAGNDRRRPDWRQIPWPQAERRLAERRIIEKAAA